MASYNFSENRIPMSKRRQSSSTVLSNHRSSDTVSRKDSIYSESSFKSCDFYLHEKTRIITNHDILWNDLKEALADSKVITSVGVKSILHDYCTRDLRKKLANGDNIESEIKRETFDSGGQSGPFLQNLRKRLSVKMSNPQSRKNSSASVSTSSVSTLQRRSSSIDVKKFLSSESVPDLISFQSASSHEFDDNSFNESFASNWLPPFFKKNSIHSRSRSSRNSTNAMTAAAIVASMHIEDDSEEEEEEMFESRCHMDTSK